MLEVVDAGLLTTVQDAGRRGHARLGVPVSGACDLLSLRIANVLAGNDPDEAALELTVVGGTYRALETVTLGLAGADLGAIEVASGRPIDPGTSLRLAPGDAISLPGRRPGRAYLALAGGIDVPAVLGSRSTCLVAGFGGFAGRPLAPGDRVPARARAGGSIESDAVRTWPGAHAPPVDRAIRVLPGPHLDVLPPNALAALADGEWSVGAASDRIGLRLDGPRIGGGPGELRSHGLTAGAIQLTPSGRPLALLADHQVTGGYPIVAVVATADLPILGQAVPGTRLTFRVATQAEAIGALREAHERFREAASSLRDDERWMELWRTAGS